MRKKFVPAAASASLSFTILKAFRNSADPYTRIAAGGLFGLSAFAFGGREIGLGVWLGTGLQGIEITKGGRITKKQYPHTIFTLHESQGIIELPAGTLPDYNCDGFTFKGLNGVYKIADGVHCHIHAHGKASFPGLGALVNQIKKGGFHNKEWCTTQGDRWAELYSYSL